VYLPAEPKLPVATEAAIAAAKTTFLNWPAWIVGALLPMTHTIKGFQELLLKGGPVPEGVWFALIFLSLLSYGLVGLIMRRQYRKIAN
jgi:ABC-type polysaccharide/polyol phosphate export permease